MAFSVLRTSKPSLFSALETSSWDRVCSGACGGADVPVLTPGLSPGGQRYTMVSSSAMVGNARLCLHALEHRDAHLGQTYCLRGLVA